MLINAHTNCFVMVRTYVMHKYHWWMRQSSYSYVSKYTLLTGADLEGGCGGCNPFRIHLYIQIHRIVMVQ